MQLLARNLLDELAAKAAASARGRAHYNIHPTASDPVQRFLVVAEPRSYFRPHRHLTKSELAMLLRGRFDVLLFDENGTLTARHEVGEGTASMGFEIPHATWHTLLARADGSAFLEIKQGPYDPATAAEFAPWSPAEGDAAAAEFLERLRTARPGERVVADTTKRLA
jgi:cupin fold WbuC family metalloprotein